MWRTIAFACCGILLALGSLVPETILHVVACLAMSTLLVWAVQRDRNTLKGFFLFGFLFSLIAFYWLPDTITLFGGFPRPIALLLFALFAATSALQFVFCGWLYRRLRRKRLSALLLALPIAWLSSEFLFPRMFPWQLGHSLVVIPSIAATADLAGVWPLSALFLWWGEVIVSLFRSIERRKLEAPGGLVLAAVVTLLLIFSGKYRNAQVAQQLVQSPSMKVALVQGNLSAKQKGDVRYLDVNVNRYRELSQAAIAEGAKLLLWPESVMNRLAPEELLNVRGSELDPFPESTAPLIYGGLAFRRRPAAEVQAILERHPDLDTPEYRRSLSAKFFNAAFGITREGEVAGRYYKRALMPFGEYLPFADRFPQLKRISPQTGDFAKGDLKEPIHLDIPNGEQTENWRSSILICYEDLVPDLSREAVSLGANILVNLTNDAWYGNTAAPYQHHLLALWRAIETRRYLLRVTNTGYTAVVDPLGATVASLPIFEEGYLVHTVQLLSGETLYSRFGDWPVRIISWLTLVVALLSPRRRTKPTSSKMK